MRQATLLLLLLRAAHALTTTTGAAQPVVWSLAGSDSSAGAGVEADLRAFRCLGARGCAVVTALTAQSTTGVEAVLETPAAHVEATIAAREAVLVEERADVVCPNAPEAEALLGLPPGSVAS